MDGIITSSFGARLNPVLAVEEFHDGIDIAVEKGTAVAAVKSGTVTQIGYSNTYGNYMTYETYDGYIIKYAHLSEVLVKEGEMVKKGCIVAKSGNSGLTTGAHLHYGVIYGDEYIDPFIFVSLPYTEDVRNEYIARNIPVDGQ